MSVPEYTNPLDWTESYVRAHRKDCLSSLENLNQRTLYELLVKGDLDTAEAGIYGLRMGLLQLIASGCQNNAIAERLIEYTFAHAILFVFADPSKFQETAEGERAERALKMFEDIRELARYHSEVKWVKGIDMQSAELIEALTMGVPLWKVREVYADRFSNCIEMVSLTLKEGESFEGLDARTDPKPAPHPPARPAAEPPAYRHEEEPPTYQHKEEPPAYRTPEKPKKAKKGGWFLGLLLVLLLIAAAGFAFMATVGQVQPVSTGEGSASSLGAEDNPYSGFLFPNSDTERIDQQEIEVLSDSDLTSAINEIYARHGYLFRNSEVRQYYEQFDWYLGEIPADEFSVDCFNQIEQENCNMLVNERNRRKASG